MALREILVSLGFEMDKQQEKSVLDSISMIKKAAIGLGVAFSVKQIADFVGETVSGVARAGDELDELSKKIGVSSIALQELAPVAAKNGASMGDLATSLRILSKNAFEASGGNKEMRAGFAELGVSVTDSNGKLKTSEQIFTELSDGFAGMTDETKRTALAQKVLGKSGTNLIPTLLMGSSALKEQRQRAHELGLVMSDELLKLSSDYTDAQKDQAGAIQGLKNAFAKELLPTFLAAARAMTVLIVKAGPLIKSLGSGLSTAMEVTSRVMRGLGQAIVVIAKGIASLGPVLGTLTVVMTALTVATTIFGHAAMIMWIKAAAPVILFILLLGIIIATIVLIIDDLVAMGDGAESVIGTMIQGVKDLINELGSIPAALWDMLMTALAYWLKFFGMNSIAAQDFTKNLTLMFTDMWKDIKDVFFFIFEPIAEFITGIISKLKLVGGGLSNLFGGKNAQSAMANPSGITSSAPLSSSSSNASFVNQPNTSVNVSIDASNSSMNPVEMGSEVRRQIGAALEDRDRQTANAFGVSMPEPAGAE
jgi:hypothetical protein